MVDFNNINTISTPALDIYKMIALERRENCIEALEFYNKNASLQQPNDLAPFKSRIGSWFMIFEPYLNRNNANLRQEMINALFVDETDDFNKLLQFVFVLNQLMDALTITKLDTRSTPKRTAEENNIELGFF